MSSFTDPFGLKVCFKGTKGDVETLKGATEKATGTSITLDDGGCISEFESTGAKGLEKLQTLLGQLVSSKYTHTVQFVEPLGGAGDQVTGKRAQYDGNTQTMSIGRNWLGSANARYPTKSLLGICFWNSGRGTYPAAVAHELLGHGGFQDANGFTAPSGEPHAIRVENLYHAAAGESSRCGG